MTVLEAPTFERRTSGPIAGEQCAKSADADLVQRFASNADPLAFESLVRRHGPMVFGVCRRMLRDPHDADDAFQATFLVLVQRARWVQPPERVGHWLYGVARRTAMKSAALKLKRQEREREAPPAAYRDVEPSDLRSLLDAELARMPQRYREAIVLCELDGMSRREAAQSLQLSEGTLSSRLSRARDLLRTRLTRRGLAFSAGALVAGLTAESSSASVSAPLLASTLHVSSFSSAIASSVAGSMPENVLALAKGVIKAMWISKVQSAAVTTVVIATLGAGTGIATHRVLAKDAPNANAPVEGKKTSPSSDGTTWNATVTSINADTIVVAIAVKGSPPATLKLANDVKVQLSGFKDKTLKPAKIADVTPGANVTLTLTPDKTTVTQIELGAVHLRGRIKEVDAAKHAITIVGNSKQGTPEKTLAVHEDAQLSFAGAKPKADAPKGKGEPDVARFSDLAAGQPVSIMISPDGAYITGITIDGDSAGGSISHVDPANKSITIASKGEGDRTFTISADAPIEIGGKGDTHAGSLSDVSEGMGVALQLSARDPKSVSSIRVWKVEPPDGKGK